MPTHPHPSPRRSREAAAGELPDIIQAQAFHARADSPLFRAFSTPAGLLGRMAGWMMVRKNLPLNRCAVELLHPQPGQAVLEIGFGPGAGLALLARHCAPGRVAGIDPSALMLRRAQDAHAPAVAAGRMDLRQGRAEALPWPDAAFQGVLAVSSVQFWNPASRSLAEALRVLEPGGRMVLGIHLLLPGKRSLTPGFTPAEVDLLEGQLVQAGFAGCTRHPVPDAPDALCLAAQRPR